FALLILVSCLIGYFFFSQKQLTEICNKALNYYINADVNIDNVELHYFSTYPFLSLKFGKTKILAKNNNQDTLLYVNGGKAELNLTAYLLRKDLIIDRLDLFGGITKVSFDEKGKLNWDIFTFSNNSKNDIKQKDTSSAPLSDIFNAVDIQRIYISSGKIVFQDFRANQKLHIEDADVKLKGSFIQKNLLSKINLDLNNLNYQDKSIKAHLANLESTIDGNGNLLGNSGLDAHFILDSVSYEHLSSGLHLIFPNLKLNISSDGDSSRVKLNLITRIQNINVDLAKRKYLKNSHVDLLLNAEYERINHNILFNNATIKVNDIVFNLQGNVSITDSGYSPTLQFELKEIPLYSIYTTALERYITSDIKVDIKKGYLHCDGKISGCYSSNSLPLITSNLNIRHLQMNLNKLKVDTFSLSLFSHLQLNDLSSSFLKIKKLKYIGDLGKIAIQGNVKRFTQNPLIDASVFVNFNLQKLKYLFHNSFEYQTTGNVKVNVKGNFALQDIISLNPALAKMEGLISIDSIKINHPEDSLDIAIDLATLKFGSQVEDSRFNSGQALFRVSLRLDSLYFKYKNQYLATLGKLYTGCKFEGKINHEVSGAMALLQFKGLRFRRPSEKLVIRSSETTATIKIAPNPEKKNSPILTTKLTSDTLSYRGGVNGILLLNIETIFSIRPRQSQKKLTAIRETQKAQPLDTSLQARKQRNLERLRDMSTKELINALIAYVSSKDTNTDVGQKFIEQFAYEGTFNFNRLRMRLQALPLPLTIAQKSIAINSRTIELKNVDIKLGKSDFNVTGSVKNFKRAMLNTGILGLELSIKSQFLDANELMAALSQANTSFKAPKTDGDTDFFNTPQIDTTQKPTEVVVIPKNISFNMSVDIDSLPIGKSLLRQLDGNVQIKDQHLFLSNFHLTNESGRMDIKLAYKADTSKKLAHLWANLVMKKIELKNLINTYPDIDSLLPMASSFEGLINCYFTTSTKMTPSMKILLGETIATCNLSGKNLVLLDGEVFSKIAKILMFKNKSKNDIDSISVELALQNGNINIFPFLISMDRYQLSVGGTQNIDHSFNYHISVLKTPLPLPKLGVDIFGTVDNFSWKMTNAKYKDLKSPTLSKKITNNTFSIQQELRRLMQKELNKIVPSQDTIFPLRRTKNR
ncbi:MAG: hypothetical protein ACRC0A_03330, partial [Chitinophagaceae bacterium]